MAMNKKEQQQLADAIEAAELAKALRWTEEVKPDVPPPKSGGYSEGWIANWHTGRVERGWSSSNVHGYGPIPAHGQQRNATQNSCWLFSSPERAMRYIRHRMEQEAAAKLMEIDRRIKEAQQ